MDAQLKQEIDDLLQNNRVVLFMKGSKNFPQCGFSATVVNVLKEAGLREFKDINILQRADLREGMKEYASWPTFPQLYVGGEFVGGCDIVKELFASGELFDVLGTKAPEIKLPKITITQAAQQAIASAAEGDNGALRIEISPQFQYALSIDEPGAGDVKIELGGITVLLDRQSASRADGMRIDFAESGEAGFKIENPNEPPRVKQIDVRTLKGLLDGGAIELFDVRTPEERAKAVIQGAQHFDAAAQQKLAELDKNTPIYFHCHHGGRSQQAAEHYLRQGFKEVYNVAGGIDAWSMQIDRSVARY
ncbi:MAG TPA: Grx4 family monothiol glutaredoxin [Polyangiales bacterium]